MLLCSLNTKLSSDQQGWFLEALSLLSSPNPHGLPH